MAQMFYAQDCNLEYLMGKKIAIVGYGFQELEKGGGGRPDRDDHRRGCKGCGHDHDPHQR